MASRTRRMTARTIRKIHVPAYWPLVVGVQVSEKRGVLKEVKKVMIMSDMDMVMEEPMSIEDIEVEVDIDIDDVEVAIDIVVLISMSISIFILAGEARRVGKFPRADIVASQIRLDI